MGTIRVLNDVDAILYEWVVLSRQNIRILSGR